MLAAHARMGRARPYPDSDPHVPSVQRRPADRGVAGLRSAADFARHREPSFGAPAVPCAPSRDLRGWNRPGRARVHTPVGALVSPGL
jgi:hypothetical protein